MEIKETERKDYGSIESQIFKRSRVHFFERFNQKIFEDNTRQAGILIENQSFSTYHRLSEMHTQKEEHMQAKLAQVLDGGVLDSVLNDTIALFYHCEYE